MAIRGRPLMPSMSSRLLVCISSYENSEIGGKIYPYYGDEVLSFNNTIAFCNALDEVFDKRNFPQKAFDYRTFKNNKEISGGKTAENGNMRMNFITEKGEKGTFVIHVQFRQNATWQGNVQWLEKNKKQNFRSALELIKLIDEALSEGNEAILGWTDTSDTKKCAGEE